MGLGALRVFCASSLLQTCSKKVCARLFCRRHSGRSASERQSVAAARRGRGSVQKVTSALCPAFSIAHTGVSFDAVASTRTNAGARSSVRLGRATPFARRSSRSTLDTSARRMSGRRRRRRTRDEPPAPRSELGTKRQTSIETPASSRRDSVFGRRAGRGVVSRVTMPSLVGFVVKSKLRAANKNIKKEAKTISKGVAKTRKSLAKKTKASTGTKKKRSWF